MDTQPLVQVTTELPINRLFSDKKGDMLDYINRVARLVELFKKLEIPQFYGEWLLKTKDLSTLEEIFGLI